MPLQLTPEQLSMIMKGYANQGANDDLLLSLFEFLSPHTPLIKEKEYKDIYTNILKVLAGERDTDLNISLAMRTFIDSLEGGVFSTLDCYTALDVKDAKGKAAIRKTLQRLVATKELERSGTKAGLYRKLVTDYEVIDLDGIVPDPLKVIFPLRIDELCNVYNGMTILTEGEKSTGKSAFGIEFAWLNRGLFTPKVRYMQNGELNKQMLTMRLVLRPQDLYPVKKFTDRIEFITRHGEWWDIINPEGLNIVDYIEEHDKKYLIPDYISKIQARLTTGIALIILQRVPGRDYGTGGAEIRNKPSVICALKRSGNTNTIHIEDIKSFDSQKIGKMFDGEVFNPRGLWREYKLIDGWKFLPKGDWRTKEDKKEYDYFRKEKDDVFVQED